MPLPPQQGQQAQRTGGQGRGHIGLVAQLTHLQIGVGHLLRQLTGEGVVVVRNGVGQHQVLAVGAEGAALGKVGREARVPPGVVQGAGVHNAQTEPPDLGRGQAAFTQDGTAEWVHRIADHAEQAPVPPVPGHAGVDGHQLPVQAVLGHADIPRRNGGIRDHPGGAEQEHVAVEQLLRRDDVHRGQRRTVRGLYLVQLELPAVGDAWAHVADADGVYHVAAHEPQAHQQRAAHIAQSQQGDAALRRDARQVGIVEIDHSSFSCFYLFASGGVLTRKFHATAGPLRSRECAGSCVLPMTRRHRTVLIKVQILCQDEARRRRPPLEE